MSKNEDLFVIKRLVKILRGLPPFKTVRRS